nr:ferredoxin [Nocardia wallacei]
MPLDRTPGDGFGCWPTHAPGHSPLHDGGTAAVEGDGTVAPADRDSVLRALLDCPVHAITELPSAESHGGTTTSKAAERISERGPTP